MSNTEKPAEARANDLDSGPDEKTIRVRAIRKGFYIRERTVDEPPFSVPERLFSRLWMEKVEGDDNASAVDAGTSKQDDPVTNTERQAVAGADAGKGKTANKQAKPSRKKTPRKKTPK